MDSCSAGKRHAVLVRCLFSSIVLIAGCQQQLVSTGAPSHPPPAAMAPQNAPVVMGSPEVIGAPIPGSAASIASAPTGVPLVPADQIVTLPANSPEESKYHEVFRGETLSGIAQKYGLTVERLCRANGIDQAAPIKPGQLLYIPPR